MRIFFGCHGKCPFNEPASDGVGTQVPPAKGSVGAVSKPSLWDTGDVACPWCAPAAWPLGHNDGFPVSTSEEEQGSECSECQGSGAASPQHSVMNNPIHSCRSRARHFLFSFALSSNIKGQREFVLLFYHRSVIWLLENSKKYKGIRFFLVPGLLQGGISCSWNLSGESMAIVLVSMLLHTSINLLVTVIC